MQVYPYGANFPHGAAHATVDGHDCRGTEDFVDLAINKPSLLLPPAIVKECEEQGKNISNATLACF